jgi:hypothetical protein
MSLRPASVATLMSEQGTRATVRVTTEVPVNGMVIFLSATVIAIAAIMITRRRRGGG